MDTDVFARVERRRSLLTGRPADRCSLIPRGKAMTYREAVAELRAKHPKADLSPSAIRGSSFDRAARIDFKKGKGGVYAGRDTDGTEVLVYLNENEGTICCTEVEPDDE